MMNAFKIISLLAISLMGLSSCGDTQAAARAKAAEADSRGDSSDTKKNPAAAYNRGEYNNTNGYWESGQIITQWDCPDAMSFPPIAISSWDKTPAVNGRFPTYAETKNGTSIHHYGEKKNAYVKPFAVTLPKLAYYFNPDKRNDFSIDHNTGKLTRKTDLVVVIQMVQTAKDTIVGYRYLTGGVGGSLFHNFHFLTGPEVKKAMEL